MNSPQRPSYLSEFVRCDGNTLSVLGGLAVSALASIPYGWSGALIPLIATVSIETLACLFVPDVGSFRRWADERWRARQRELHALQLRAEIGKRSGNTQAFAQCMDAYAAVVQRVASLCEIARERPGQLALEDVARIQDVQNEFLALQLALRVIDERARAVNLPEIVRKLERIEQDIAHPPLGADTRQLVRAQQDYQALIARHQRMMSRRTAIEAAITALPDQLDEIFQMVMTAPGGDNGEPRLTDAIARLRLQEDMEDELSNELGGDIPSLQAIARSPAQAAARQQANAH